MKLNIRQLAKQAHVSVATISRVINPDTRHRVAGATRQRIDTLIQELGYTPHFAAKNLRKTSTKTIGIVFPYVENIFYSSYYAHILAGVSNYLLRTAYQFKLILLKQEKEKWANSDFYAGEGVDGLISTQWFRFFANREVINQMKIPCVIINDYEAGIKARFVCADNLAGGQMVAEHLLEKGHHCVACLAGPDWSRDSGERLEGFRGGLLKKGFRLGKDLIQTGDFDNEKITAGALDQLLSVRPRITAIFCCNDNMAIMVMNRLKEKKILCPQKISVVGFDDDWRSAGLRPALTTVRMPVYHLAQEAVRSLITHLESRVLLESFHCKTILPVQFVERKSVFSQNI
ncbi:MAG: LacI family DNA-binding transcriptional regulator [Candidatus Omnitrophica bacterium]|nr:LacI family DNA-binding transcriptional regulator [Candidatus Omnitrophota bacterium]